MKFLRNALLVIFLPYVVLLLGWIFMQILHIDHLLGASRFHRETSQEATQRVIKSYDEKLQHYQSIPTDKVVAGLIMYWLIFYFVVFVWAVDQSSHS